MVGDTPRPGGVASVVLGAEQATDDIVQWSVDDGSIREGERRASAHSRRASYHSRMVVRSARLAGAHDATISSVVRGSSLVDSCGFVGIKDDMVAWVVLGGFVRTKDDRGWCGGCRPWSVGGGES